MWSINWEMNSRLQILARQTTYTYIPNSNFLSSESTVTVTIASTSVFQFPSQRHISLQIHS